MNVLDLIGRDEPLFAADVQKHEAELSRLVADSRFLVVGGAGTIGQAVVREIFRRSPRVLDVVDISENNLVELVRDLRSSLGYIDGTFRTFAVDAGSAAFAAMLGAGTGYDYVLNLAALKHVRSEKDPWSLMRMIEVNIDITLRTATLARDMQARKYFCVSTDKAAAPVNMMGASKRIMELFLMRASESIPVSTARFANVAFFGRQSFCTVFNQRLLKRQPLSAPNDVRRYFVTDDESGELCLMSCLFGENRDIFFPKLSEKLHLITFAEIAVKYLAARGLQAVPCSSEDEARASVAALAAKGSGPAGFFSSDTTGEKDFEEFFTTGETLDWQRFDSIGVIQNPAEYDLDKLQRFQRDLAAIRGRGTWSKQELLALFNDILPDFAHKETGRYLDAKM